jgi:hypothetical protein
VETKLWRNPEARRSVVAQLIEYATEMAGWFYEDLVKALKKAGMGSGKDPLIELFKEREGEEFDKKQFIDKVSSNLHKGRSLLLIVGDGIQEGLERMTSFLQQSPQLGFNLNLVEIGLYRELPDKKDPIFVQPRILARTREVTRAIVEIKVPVKRTKIIVTTPEPKKEKTTRRRITEEEFFAQLQKLDDPRAVEFARYVLDNIEDHDLRIDDDSWVYTGFILRYGEKINGAFLNFGQLKDTGEFGWTSWWWANLTQQGLPLEIWRDYFDEIAKLIPNASRQNFFSKKVQWEQISLGKNPKAPINPPFGELAANKEQFMAAIDKAIQRLREYLDNE